MLKSRNVEVKVHAQQQWHRLEEWAVIPEKTRGSLIKSYANSSLSVVSQKGEANNISCRKTSSSGASRQILLLLQIQRDLSYQRFSSTAASEQGLRLPGRHFYPVGINRCYKSRQSAWGQSKTDAAPSQITQSDENPGACSSNCPSAPVSRTTQEPLTL